MSTPLIVNCPTCAEPVVWKPENESRPFCSERCQQIDLGAWASEEYSVPSESQDEWDMLDASSSTNSEPLQ